MTRYSALALALNALTGQRRWTPAWRAAAPKPAYDVVIVGGGGHGLATAYYLAKEHGITNVAVLEKGWLGGGNVGRNTTIVRSNYLLPGNARFYEHSHEALGGAVARPQLQRDVLASAACINLAHPPAQLDAFARRGNAMRSHGVDAELIDRDAVAPSRSRPRVSTNTRFPILGGLLQPRGGTARHDAVAWGYARAADRRGVDIVENCEVTGFVREDGRDRRRRDDAGDRRAARSASPLPGSSSEVAAHGRARPPADREPRPAGVRVRAAEAACSTRSSPSAPATSTSRQSDKGGLVFGGDLDGYNSYAQRGNLPIVEHVSGGGGDDDSRSSSASGCCATGAASWT